MTFLDKLANPPLSASEALKKAKAFVATIPNKDTYNWRFDALELNCAFNDECWLWHAVFSEMPNTGRFTGTPTTMDCLILFDGNVILPIVNPHK